MVKNYEYKAFLECMKKKRVVEGKLKCNFSTGDERAVGHVQGFVLLRSSVARDIKYLRYDIRLYIMLSPTGRIGQSLDSFE